MYCPKCGAPLPDESVFCPQCGNHVGVLFASGSAPRSESLEQAADRLKALDEPGMRPEADVESGTPFLVGKGASASTASPASPLPPAASTPDEGLRVGEHSWYPESPQVNPLQVGAMQTPAQAPASHGKRRGKILIGGGVAAVIVAAIVCALVVVNPFAPRGVSIEDSFADTSLVTLVSKYDHDNDGKLTSDEVAEITQVDLSGTEVKSVQGIEHLTSVRTLNVSRCAQLHELDLPQLPELTTVCTTGSAVERLAIADSPKLNDIQVDDTTEVVGSERSAMREEWLLTKFEYTGLSGVLPPQSGWIIESGSFQAEYDEQNRLVKLTESTRSMGQDFTDTTQYAYDENGKLSERVQEYQNGKRDVTRFTYDEEGRLTSDGSRSFEYDATGCLSAIPGQVSVVSENGRIVSMRSSSTSNSTAESFKYDEKGRVVLEDDAASRYRQQSTTSFEYDEAGDVTRIMNDYGSFGYIDVLDYDDRRVITSARREYVSQGAISATSEITMTRDEHGNVAERVISPLSGSSNPSTGKFTYKRVFVPADAPELENVYKLTNPLNAPKVTAVPRAYVFPETPVLARDYLSELTSRTY